MPTVSELLPMFCVELQELLHSVGRGDLAKQVPNLPIVDRCACSEPSCAQFYTAAPPSGAYGPGHANLTLPSNRGLVALDVIRNTIVAIEVLDRPDVKRPLDASVPPSRRRPWMLPCPACGFLTAPDSSYGSHHICEICDWEDDAVQLANPASGGGANTESLVEAQAAALAHFPATVHEERGIFRSPVWRPLSPEEIATARAEREVKHWANEAIINPHECYWVRGARDAPRQAE